ncbi:hypothetical protein [Haloprofundus salinisoli]|uniref:hypothetical protein n=1 Tax=Haloprofundus salinisoli TaxID=2876193 RepID=UPI001CCE6D69|nr:hypothetical protein [Haloprofundus salinisoli]
MLLQTGLGEPSFAESAPRLALVDLLSLVAFAATYLVVRTLFVAFVEWTTGGARTRLGRVGATAAKGYALLIALSTGLGVAGFGSFQLLFSLLGVGAVGVFAGVVYRVERSLTGRQRS